MIKLENLSKDFQTKTGLVCAVKNLSFEIKKGELCVLLGPSGCGKTTTMKMINRLIPMTGGKIYIDGRDINQLDQNLLRRDIGYAIQDIGLFPHYTVEENITTVPVLKKWPKPKRHARAGELLQLVGMDPDAYLHRYPSELSGGQQQRVGVARSLGADPPILLMDEPFGAIDPITRSKLQDEFLKIQSKLRKTIVFVTHDIDEAIKLGDKIALLKNGELIQYDEPVNLLYSPVNEFVRDFVGSDHILKSLRLHKTAEVMQPPRYVAKINQTPQEILASSVNTKDKWLMVTDQSDRFVGWVSKKELAAGGGLKQVLKYSDITANTEERLNESVSMMFKSTFGTLPVVDEDKKLHGILSFDIIKDVLQQMMEEED